MPFSKPMSPLNQLMLFCVAFSALSIVFVLYKAFVPETVLTVSVNPLPIVTYAHDPGLARSIAYRLNYCKTIDAPSTVVRELRSVDQTRIVSLYTSGYSLPKGCGVVDIIEPMPSYIPPGIYNLRITFTYRVNAITDPYTFVTQPFQLQ